MHVTPMKRFASIKRNRLYNFKIYNKKSNININQMHSDVSLHCVYMTYTLYVLVQHSYCIIKRVSLCMSFTLHKNYIQVECYEVSLMPVFVKIKAVKPQTGCFTFNTSITTGWRKHKETIRGLTYQFFNSWRRSTSDFLCTPYNSLQ